MCVMRGLNSTYDAQQLYSSPQQCACSQRTVHRYNCLYDEYLRKLNEFPLDFKQQELVNERSDRRVVELGLKKAYKMADNEQDATVIQKNVNEGKQRQIDAVARRMADAELAHQKEMDKIVEKGLAQQSTARQAKFQVQEELKKEKQKLHDMKMKQKRMKDESTKRVQNLEKNMETAKNELDTAQKKRNSAEQKYLSLQQVKSKTDQKVQAAEDQITKLQQDIDITKDSQRKRHSDRVQ